jgi:phosphoribosylpyrophosphate synthetase
VTTPVRGRDVVLLGTLDRPDERTIPALLTAAALRDLGARSVGLVAPYLSTAGTMIAAVRLLRRARLRPPVCVGVHAVFATGAYASLRRAGAARVVTCNTSAHRSNAIDVAEILAAGVRAAQAPAARARPPRPT